MIHAPRRGHAHRGGISAACPILTALTGLAALVALTACGRESSGSAGAESAAIVVPSSDVHVVGTPESVTSVRDLDVLSDGSVWVLDAAEPFFVGFRPDGTVLRAYGRRGGGPGEFGNPVGFVEGGIDGQAWAFDMRRHAMIEVSRPDSADGEILLPRRTIPPMSLMPGISVVSNYAVRTARLGRDLILPRRSHPRETGIFSYWLSVWTADLVALDPKTDSVHTVVSLDRVLGDATSHFDMTGSALPFPLWNRLWTVCQDREIRVYDRLRNTVLRFGADGTELGSIALPPVSTTPVTREQYARDVFTFALVEVMGRVPATGRYEVSPADTARILKGLMSRITAPPERLTKLLPRYTDLRCDAQGTMWMRPFDAGEGGLTGGPVWLRIMPDGRTDRVRLPDRFDPYRFTLRRIWGVQRDTLDVASVAWIAAPGES